MKAYEHDGKIILKGNLAITLTDLVEVSIKVRKIVETCLSRESSANLRLTLYTAILRLFIASSAHFCTVLDKSDQSIVPRKFFSSSGMARGRGLSLKQPTGSNLISTIQEVPIS